MTTLFEQKAPWIMGLLMKDFGIAADDAAAILGNLGHECAGFTDLVEFEAWDGGKGGFGWAQWTGPRRRAYEAYCRRNKLEKYSDKANYGFLFMELKTTEKGSLAKLKAASGLIKKVIAFEKAFERAGVKNYPSRQEYAATAMRVFYYWDGKFPEWVDNNPPPVDDDVLQPPSPSVTKEIILFLERLIAWLRKFVKS